MVWDKAHGFNDSHKEDEWIGPYEAIQLMAKSGELTAQEVDDIVVSNSDTGWDILSFIYERSLDREALELFACKEEYDEILDFALNPDFEGVPGCDAQGYYIINLDNNTIKMTFDDFSREFNLIDLPSNIELEMLVFEKITDKVYKFSRENGNNRDIESLAKATAEIVLDISNGIKEEYSDILNNPDELIQVEEYARNYVLEQLIDMVAQKEAKTTKTVDNLVSDAVKRSANNTTQLNIEKEQERF